MNFTNQIELLLFWVFLGLVMLNVIYLFVFSIAGLFASRRVKRNIASKHAQKMLVVFPAYREDEVIVEAVKSMLEQDYPKTDFTVAVVADSFQPATIETLKNMGAMVSIIPSSEKRNKARAINYLFSQLSNSYSICVVMDADNIVKTNFLTQVNHYFENGVRVLQTKRIAKNTTGNLALLDTYSEIINNHIFRKGQEALGFSSSLIGSGMAFEFSLFAAIMNDIDVYSGFDKELELRLLKQNIKIYYAPEVEVMDEKVSAHPVFVNQRRRWVYAQLYFLRNNTGSALQALFSGNFDYANKVLQFALLPRIVVIGLSALLFVYTVFSIHDCIVYSSILLMLLAIALFIPLRSQRSIIKSPLLVFTLFSTFLQMVIAILTANRAAGKFLHTPHKSS